MSARFLISRCFVILTVSIYSGVVNAEKVFRLTDPSLMFSYPDNWSVEKEKNEKFVVVVRSDTNSGAVCRIGRKRLKKLQGLTEGEMETFRSNSYVASDVIERHEQAFSSVSLKKYWRGSLGLREAQFIEIEWSAPIFGVELTFFGLNSITYERDSRFALSCAEPSYYSPDLKRAFEVISKSLRFESE